MKTMLQINDHTFSLESNIILEHFLEEQTSKRNELPRRLQYIVKGKYKM